jgi:soluble lytic murein transglycosylase-like protein
MPLKPRIERLREMVSWESIGIPVPLLLAIIHQESRGSIGLKARVNTKPWAIPSINGGNITFNKAMGLMQVVPRTLAAFNNRHPSSPVYYEQMVGKTLNDARLQIRVGAEVLAHEIDTLHNRYPNQFPSSVTDVEPNQLLFAILAYRMGSGSLGKRLTELKARGLNFTYENIKSQFPKWGYNSKTGKWINRPIYYTDKIWNAAIDGGMVPGLPGEIIIGPSIPSTQIASTSGAGMIAAVVIGLMWIGSRK